MDALYRAGSLLRSNKEDCGIDCILQKAIIDTKND